jgi:RimJ/RimL family protein N-acetyltransferase
MHLGEPTERVALPNQRDVRIRCLCSSEEHTIRALWDHLSPRSRYLRFLSVASTLPDSLVRSLVAVDNQRTLALVAERDTEAAVDIIGLASFAAVDDDQVEVGVVVRDDWQRRRVGTELATRVMQAAERRGFSRFVGHITTENVAVRGLLAKVGVVVASRVSRGVSEIAFVRRVT